MDHLTKMYTVRSNVCQMLADRSFLVAEVGYRMMLASLLACLHVCFRLH